MEAGAYHGRVPISAALRQFLQQFEIVLAMLNNVLHQRRAFVRFYAQSLRGGQFARQIFQRHLNVRPHRAVFAQAMEQIVSDNTKFAPAGWLIFVLDCRHLSDEQRNSLPAHGNADHRSRLQGEVNRQRAGRIAEGQFANGWLRNHLPDVDFAERNRLLRRQGDTFPLDDNFGQRENRVHSTTLKGENGLSLSRLVNDFGAASGSFW